MLLLLCSTNGAPAGTTDENAVSRSYIHKHSPAWRSFALAKDINKREKLKKALRNALKSVVTDERKSEITTSGGDVESASSLTRITHAAKLLKEFQQIHKLSETVKRTLSEYNTAKSDLSQSIQDNSGINMLKRFLVGRTKRTFVPHAMNLTLGDVRPMEAKSMILDKPHYLKHTDKISVIAEPLTEEKGKVGLEFISVDPKTSTMDRANKAFKAANILLDFVGSERKDPTEHVDGLIETLRNDIDGINKVTNDENEKKKKSLLASKANNLFIDKPTDGVQVTGAKKQTIEPNTNNNKSDRNVVTEASKVMKSESVSEIEQEKEDELKNSMNNSKQAQQKDNNTSSNSSNNNSVTTTTTTTNNNNNNNNSNNNNNNNVSTKRGQDEISTSAEDMLHNTLKQQETLRTLKEAKVARQKYEIARHELAQKVKELYKMANDYEKEETDNQVLEVKNDHIPKAQNTPSSSSAVDLPEDNVHVPHSKRDDAHPGMALSGVSNRPIKAISTATSSDDGEHKSFTMGAIDKKEHQVDIDDVKEKQSTQATFKAVPAKRKSEEPATSTNNLPSNVKLDELKDEVGKNMKSQEQSLKVIAEAIKEDMKDIANVNKKKKMVADAMTTSSGGKKKDKQSTDKLDEYLTKALSDIMGSESVPGNEAGKEAEEKQKEKADNTKTTKEDNMKIIAEAMKSSSNDLPLPLVSTKGDKILAVKNGSENNKKTEKSDQRDTNDVLQHVSDHEKKPLDLTDPANKSLLEKASHLEEQVASQQDKLYSSNNNAADNGPAPAKQNVEFSPSEPKSSADPVKPTETPQAASSVPSSSSSEENSGKKDAYGSIKETIDNPANRERMEEEPYDDDGKIDGFYRSLFFVLI